MHKLFECLKNFNEIVLWGYLGLGMVISFGLYFSFRARWIQVFHFWTACKHFVSCMKHSTYAEDEEHGVSPIKLFFATIGGAIGIGNLAGVALAIQIGGPGALVWVLLVALLGMIIKYSEVYLGIKYRRHIPGKKGYEGGPMYFLQKAFPKYTWIAYVMAFLLCIYGVEIYMFNVVKYSFQTNFHLNPYLVMGIFLVLIFLGVFGGIERVGAINTILIPGFVILYLIMTLWVIFQEIHLLPGILKTILKSAFTGHAAVGGFTGSTFLLTLSKGLSSGAYSGDIGIGYASIIHSETRFKEPSKQASLTILGIFLDTFVVCMCTILLVIVTGVWKLNTDSSLLVQEALSHYFPYMDYFMPLCLFILGYSTITAYFVAGIKCADFIWPSYGKKLYMIYGFCAFIIFSFIETRYAFAIMSTAGGLLMVINLAGIMKLRKDIVYKV